MGVKNLKKLLLAIDKLGPMVYHNHSDGFENCEACRIAHPFAPHFDTCRCGHCPDPEEARQRVINALRKEDGK
jgi:hypothetical protein